MKRHLWLFPLALTLLLAACNGTSTSSGLPSLTPADLNTEQTDALKLTVDYVGKEFITDGIGEVTLRSVTDGDTARFNSGNENIAVRFLGIDTPESTGIIEPWGNFAANFVREILSNATKIVLINDVAEFGRTDSAGRRYLGFIWYQRAAGEDLRLLNLEIVEQALSPNLLFRQTPLVPYQEAFRLAGERAVRTGARIHGTRNDPTFDYSGRVYDVSIRFIRKAFGNTVPLEDRFGNIVLDENDEPVMFTMTNSNQLRIQAVVLASIASNVILRDVYNPDDNGDFASIFIFTQFREVPFNQPGDVIQLYAKATTFNGNVQLTDPVMQTFHPFFPLELIARVGDPNYAEVLALNDMVADVNPFDLTQRSISRRDDFAPFNGYFVKTRITVRARPEVSDDEFVGNVILGDFFRKDINNNMTIYGFYAGTNVSFNIRIDGNMFPYVSENNFAIGKTYEVSGYIVPFFENYQIQLPNGATIVEVV